MCRGEAVESLRLLSQGAEWSTGGGEGPWIGLSGWEATQPPLGTRPVPSSPGTLGSPNMVNGLECDRLDDKTPAEKQETDV